MQNVCVITGGCGGMGLATAKIVGKEQKLILVDKVAVEKLESAVSELKALGIEAEAYSCDVTDQEAVKEVAANAASQGRVKTLIHTAGVDFSKATPEQIVKINMQGTHHVLEAFLPYLDDSTVVNISSITGYLYAPQKEDFEVWSAPDAENFSEKVLALIPPPIAAYAERLGPSYPAYCCSKRFVIYYTMANVARVAKKNNSRIISIAPGSFNTPMLASQAEYLEAIIKGTALGRVGEPEEMAGLIASLLEPGHEYLTGCDIIMDGGKYAMATIKQFV